MYKFHNEASHNALVFSAQEEDPTHTDACSIQDISWASSHALSVAVSMSKYQSFTKYHHSIGFNYSEFFEISRTIPVLQSYKCT